MRKENSWTGFEQILDDTNQMIQISDLATYSMMYANQPARQYTNHGDQPYRGQRCYQYMMGLEEQCPFCPMRQMGEQDSCITEVDNGVQVFTVKTKRIIWEGVESFIEYATDITTIKRAQQIFETQMKTLIQSIPEAQGIFHLNLTQDHLISINGVSRSLENLKEIIDMRSFVASLAAFVPDRRERSLFEETFQREALIKAYQNGSSEVSLELHSYFDDDSIRWANLTARLLMNPNTGDLECIFYGMDIQERKTYQERMNLAEQEKSVILERSRRDLLTGVYGKTAFEQMAEVYITEHPAQSFAILFLDLDHFKKINDTLGHLVGDQAIIDTADKLQTIFSNKDVISRFGGDEFCVLIKRITKKDLVKKMDDVLRKLRTVYSDETASVSITVSIGVCFCTGGARLASPLIEQADQALYQAKRNGRDQYCIVDAE